MYELKIPKARIGCLIGKKGKDKRVIEKATKTKIKVSSEGDVEILGDGLDAYLCEKVVMAIGRGFSPETALNLLNEDYNLEIIDIKSFFNNNKNKIIRAKARLIGKRGKARKVIERLTDCELRIYGKTATIIGKTEKLSVAFRGVEKLLKGSPHGNVYSFLEREMKKLKESSVELLY